jgi:Uncharacterized protein conserved in bacteria
MKTDSLIDLLSASPAPVPRAAALFARAVSLGALAALALTMVLLGPRHDVQTAMASWQYWMKSAYPLLLAVAAFFLMRRLSQPGAVIGKRPVWLLAPLGAIAAAALVEWQSAAGAGAQAHLFYGHSWRLCPFLIVLISTPVFIATLWVMKKMAPTRLALAGAAAGLFAGALGAWIYAFHCNESALTFVSIWYTAGIAAVALIGAISGRWLLRW